MADQLRVTSIQIRDVLGAREFAVEPGRITLLRGANGSGKSTALQAVQSALAGGNLARLARVDPDGKDVEPEVVLVIDGPRSEEYRVERTGDKVRVRQRVGDTAAFEDVRKPQAWLTGLFDPRGSNPVAFLMAADKDRALMLLEALPLTMPRQELLQLLAGVDPAALPPIPTGLHPLEELSLIRDAVFRARTGVNRDKDGKAKAADQTRRNAPAVIPDDPSPLIAFGEQATSTLAAEIARDEEAARAAERQALAVAQAAHELAAQKVKAAFTEAARALRADHVRQVAELRATVEKQIADMTASTEAAIAGLRESDDAKLDQLDALLQRAQAEARDRRASTEARITSARTTLAESRDKLAALRAERDDAAKARTLHDQAKQFDQEATALVEESARLTAVIESLDAFRRRLAEDLPIEGLEIEGKEIRVRGVPYEQLNTAQRIDIAVQVACLRAKTQRLPVVFVDGAEALDTEHFHILVERLKEAGVQSFIGRVEDHELRVEVA